MLSGGQLKMTTGTGSGTKQVLITGCQLSGWAFPFHSLPLLPNWVMEKNEDKDCKKQFCLLIRTWYKITICRHSGLSGMGMQWWALAGDRVRAWTTGHWFSSWTHQGTCTTSTDASVRKNYWFLSLETKDVGSLCHQTMPCLRIQFYPIYVKCWLSQSGHIWIRIVL